MGPDRAGDLPAPSWAGDGRCRKIKRPITAADMGTLDEDAIAQNDSAPIE
jgi:hypothetical protein